jgi:hypothetical protein
MFRDFRFAALTVCALALTFSTTLAEGVTKPFKITGVGVGPKGLPLPGQDPRPHWIVGNATHLGKHCGLGAVQIDTVDSISEDGVITGKFGSSEPFVFVGANGKDVLSCQYGRTDAGASEPGTFTLTPTGKPGEYVAEFVAEFVPVDGECTGKFEGVSGSWIMYAVTEPFILGASDPVAYSWEGEGKLTFKKK